MASPSGPTSPSSGAGAATPCNSAIQPCADQPLDCPQVEIEINNTPATNDDLVQLKCTLPAKRYKIGCRIRAIGGGAGDATIVLTNPDGRLRFPNDGETTKTLSVPRNGAWTAFEISGEVGSIALNDAVIEAHCNTATGALKGRKTVTVFWFDQAKIDITSGGNYTIIASRYTVPAGANAANFIAEARIRPAGINCRAPQVLNLWIGIAQNTFPPRIRTINWGNPTIQWNIGVPRGTSVVVPTKMRKTIIVGTPANDSTRLVDPLYDQPGKVGAEGTIDENSLRPPIGCSAGGAATSYDTPSLPIRLSLPGRTAAGIIVGQVDWTFINATHRDNYRTWVVVFNISNNDICPIRERVWRTNMDSAATGAQHITVDVDSAPTVAPLTGEPFSNTLSNDPMNITIVPVDTNTTSLLKV